MFNVPTYLSILLNGNGIVWEICSGLSARYDLDFIVLTIAVSRHLLSFFSITIRFYGNARGYVFFMMHTNDVRMFMGGINWRCLVRESSFRPEVVLSAHLVVN